MFKDNDDTARYADPGGHARSPAGGYLRARRGRRSASGSAARSRRASTTRRARWSIRTPGPAHATTTYGRCPNGTGAFVAQATVTKGAANDCGGGAGGAGGGAAGTGGGAAGRRRRGGQGGAGGSVATLPWPGDNAVVTVDAMNQFPSNLSGLFYQPATATRRPCCGRR